MWVRIIFCVYLRTFRLVCEKALIYSTTQNELIQPQKFFIFKNVCYKLSKAVRYDDVNIHTYGIYIRSRTHECVFRAE